MSAHPELVQLCLDDGVALRASGPGRYYGKCPFHHDTRPSFQVKLSRNGFWTFRCWSTNCGAHGGLKRYLELTNRPPSELPEKRASGVEIQQNVPAELCHQAAEHYNRQLLEHAEAVQYLQSRGIDPELAREWGVGYAHRDSLFRELSNQLSEETLHSCYLFRSRKREDRQARRIIIPHWRNGRAGWHTGRAIDADNHRPYQSLPGQRPALLALRSQSSPRGFLIIVEGPFDLMACLSAGYDARCTAGNPEPRQLTKAIRQLRPKRIGILPDRDSAGQQWAEYVAEASDRARVPSLVMELPQPFKDPGETLLSQRGGPRTAIATAVRVARAKLNSTDRRS